MQENYMLGDWAELADKWVNFMIASGRPRTTIEMRIYHVARCSREVGREDPRDVSLDDLLAWLAVGRGQWSPHTLRAYRSSLRAFFGWCAESGHLAANPASGLPPVRVPRGRPRPCPEEALAQALQTAPTKRLRRAIRMGAQCGMRRAEIAGSHTEDLVRDLHGWSLRVTGKGGHVRLVPVPDDLAAEIRDLPPGWIFPSPSPRHPGKPVTAAHLGKEISRLLPGSLTTHTLRHRAGTIAYANTHDLRAVQELLGHAKPETTAIYTEVPLPAIRAAMESAAPDAWRPAHETTAITDISRPGARKNRIA